MGKKSRVKGAGYEREVAQTVSRHLGVNVSRHLGQARDGGQDLDLPGWAIECKRRARIGNVYDWLQQAGDAARDGEAPAVIARADNKPSVVLMYLDDWLELLKMEDSGVANFPMG